MMDREALAAALEFYDTNDGAFVMSHVSLYIAAARERLAQLPETCETCKGTRGYSSETGDLIGYGERWQEWTDCPSCHGRGTVYPPALVERIAEVLDWWTDGDSKAEAVAVLDALNNETPMTDTAKPRRKVYLTDRDDDGKLLGYLIAVDGAKEGEAANE